MAVLYTIGHSTRPLEEFLAMLQAHGIRRLLDIRTVPRSRKNPQYNLETLPADLSAHGIAHEHWKELGGLRKPRTDSPNTAWRNESFRGYADYMQTPEFDAAIERLLAATEQCPTAIMCAESVPWRCHRSLVADAAAARGAEVRHIMSAQRADPHRPTPFARTEGTRVFYPGLS